MTFASFTEWINWQVAIGLLAGFWGTVQYLPQVRLAWQTRSTRDLSRTALLRMACSHSLWIAYGFCDPVNTWTTAFYNIFNIVFVGSLIWLKLREKEQQPEREIFPGIPAGVPVDDEFAWVDALEDHLHQKPAHRPQRTMELVT